MSMVKANPPDLEMKKNVGKYIIVYNSEKNAVKIVSFNIKKGIIIFEVIRAPDRKEWGKKFKARYDRNYCDILVYTTKKEIIKKYNEG